MYDYEPCDFCPKYRHDGSCAEDCETIREFRKWMKFIAIKLANDEISEGEDE